MKTALTVVGGIASRPLLAIPHAARANLLQNGSLETAATPDKHNLVSASYLSNANIIPGWTITRGAVDVVPNSYWQANLGNDSVDLAGSPGLGTIQQTVTTVIGNGYRLTFEFAINPQNLTSEAGSTKHLVVDVTTATGTVEAAQAYSGTAGTRTLSNMEYIQETFTFTATSTSTILMLGASMPSGLGSNFNSNNVWCGPVIDNLDLESTGGSSKPPPTPTPEPASLALLGVGGLGLMRRGRRRA